MNYNRRRNIFTLGDFNQYPNPTQQIKAQNNRRQNSDPFERDPFKIQSYNFRYAERPSYPLANLGNNRAHRTRHSPPSHKRFETFFYNYDFTPSVHDKENPPANNFREFRRRKFLLDNQHQNPAAACMFGPATNCRGPSTLQQTMYEQLHPGAEYARVIGTSASQTEIATAAAAAAAAANAGAGTSGSGYGGGGRVRGAADNGGRHHQTLGSATDTSSIGTAAGLRSPRDYNSTSPHIYANQHKYGHAAAARSTGNREYLRALATAHIGASAQPNYLGGRGRCSSRSSLERGRRLRAEPLGGGGSRIGQQVNSSFGASIGRAKGADIRELSGTRASPSKYARQRAQTVHSASPNRVTATVEKAEGTCSGCQININIKGLDSTQLGDNVVIKIESDKNSPSKITSKTEQFHATNNIHNGNSNAQRNDIAFAKLVEIKRNSEMNRNLDIKPKVTQQPTTALPKSSSASFVIDKRLSKFAMASSDEREQRKHMPRSSSHSRVPVTSSTTRAMGFSSSPTAIRVSNSSEAINRITRSVSKERMPSMVPWCLDTTLRHGFSRDNDDTKSLRAHPSNLIKHARPSYDATLNDVRKMRRQAVVAAYKPFSLQRTSATSRKAENFGSGGGNKGSEKCKKPPGPAAANGNADSVQQRQSRHSLRSTVNSHSNPQLEIGRSPTLILRRSRSSVRPGPAAQHAAESQSHVSVKTTPLNVNINVFADKLKLLRV